MPKKITVELYSEEDREADTDAIYVSLPDEVGERVYEQVLDNYFYLSTSEAHDLYEALGKALQESS